MNKDHFLSMLARYKAGADEIAKITWSMVETRVHGAGVTADQWLAWPGVAKYIQARIQDQRPKIGYGGGVNGYFHRCIVMAEKEPRFLMRRPDNFGDAIQLLWDLLLMGRENYALAAMVYYLLMEHTFHQQRFNYTEQFRKMFVGVTRDSMPCLDIPMRPDTAVILHGLPCYLSIRLMSGLEVDSIGMLIALMPQALLMAFATLAVDETTPLLRWMQLVVVTHGAMVGVPGEAIPFALQNVAHVKQFPHLPSLMATNVHGAYEATRMDVGVREHVMEMRARFIARQRKAAVHFAQWIPRNGYVWHYLAMYFKDVTEVTVETSVMNVAFEDATRVDSAFAASGIAKAHWTRHAHAYGRRFLRGQWHTLWYIQEDAGEKWYPALRTSGRRCGTPPSDLVLGVRPDLERVIATLMLGMQRLVTDGRIASVDPGLLEDTLECLELGVGDDAALRWYV